MQLAAKPGIRHLWLPFVAFVLVTAGNSAIAQSDAPVVPDPKVLDAAAIDAMKTAIDSDAALDEATKTRVLEVYDQALEAIEQSEQAATRLTALTEKIETAAQRREQLSRRLERGDLTSGQLQLPDGLEATEISALWNRARAQLEGARETLRARTGEYGSLRATGASGDDELVRLEAELLRIQARFERASRDDLDALGRAQQTSLLAQQAKIQLEQQVLRGQLENFNRLVSLATLERDAASFEVERFEAQAERLQTALEGRRTLDAKQARRDAEAVMAATTLLPAPVAALAETNVELRKELVELNKKTSDVSRRLRSTEHRLDDVEEELETVQLRVETWGSSPAVGRLLRRRLDRLPSAFEYHRYRHARQNEINIATDRSIDIEEQTTEIPSVDQQINDLVPPPSSKDSTREETRLREQTRDLIIAQRDTLAQLSEAYRRYLAQLTRLDASERELEAIVTEATRFIRRELVWIRSLGPLSGADFLGLPQALGTLASGENWRQALRDLRDELQEQPLASALGLAIIAAIFLVRRRAPAALAELGTKTRQIRTDSFLHTLKALAYSLTAAAAWPLTIAYIGWHLQSAPRAPFSAAVGAGLLGLAAFLFSVSSIRWVLRPQGLARIHFRWPGEVADAISRELRWFAIVGWALAPIIGSIERIDDPIMLGAVVRPAFIAACGAMVIFVWRVFGPSSSLARHFARNYPDYWVTRLRYLWFPLLIALPFALAIAAIVGYQHTARTFARLLTRETLWFLVGLLLLRALLLRWFILAERRLRLASAIRQREEARHERQQEEKPEAESFDIEVPEPDYKELGEQARSLVRVGVFVGVFASLFGLWGDFVPFYAVFENVTLPYSKTSFVEGVETQAPATLADLGLGLLLLIATGLAAKNLPGLLEFTALRYFRVDSGARYAFLTLCQYAIVTLGVIMAFSTMGMEWQKLQWLVAALGVGLGFGLQEIVANFVSGIILLVERPIRVGDIVTVGNASGAVSKIQIRATTIQTYDSQELLVPNKEFITGQLLNWTLSDQTARILLYVGIAYGSDVERALKLILEAATEEARVLDEPAPSVNFEGFGDNALNLSLRAHVGSLDHRLATQTVLHKSIYEKFAAAGIEIAFPQRDLHLDAREPLRIRILGEEPAGH